MRTIIVANLVAFGDLDGLVERCRLSKFDFWWMAWRSFNIGDLFFRFTALMIIEVLL